ncbi:hypothetical protein P7C70_g8212, partial [Phenoliferia sp. Uapishka_3]
MVYYGDKAPTASELANAFEAYVKVKVFEDDTPVNDVPPTRAQMQASLAAFQATVEGADLEVIEVDVPPTAAEMENALASYEAVKVEVVEDVKPEPLPVVQPVIQAAAVAVAGPVPAVVVCKSARLGHKQQVKVLPAKKVPGRPKAKRAVYRYNPKQEWPATEIVRCRAAFRAAQSNSDVVSVLQLSETVRHYRVSFEDSLVSRAKLKFWSRSVLSQKAPQADGRVWVRWKASLERKGDVGKGLIAKFK